MLYFILRYIIRYRLKIVKKNIARSFPEKDKKDCALIVNNFYRHFIRQNLESIKFIFMSPKSIKKKFIFENIEIIEDIAKKNQNITLVLGHYGTWDWIASIPLWSNKLIFGALYKRIKNNFFNNLFLKIRSRFGIKCIEMKQALKGIIELNKGNKPNLIVYIADQCPWNERTKYWIKFLNQPTATQSGWATIAQKFDTAVVYLKINPISKGKYVARFELLTESPNDVSKKYLVETFFTKLERDIKEQPEYWLWSHKRWKYTQIENQELKINE